MTELQKEIYRFIYKGRYRVRHYQDVVDNVGKRHNENLFVEINNMVELGYLKALRDLHYCALTSKEEDVYCMDKRQLSFTF